MSSIKHPNSDVDHTNYLSEHIGFLYLNEEFSDITIRVDGMRFPLNRVILAARSKYFKALLYGGMKESRQTEIEMRDVPLEAFKSLLKYMYTGHMALTDYKEDVILDILGLTHQYGVTELESAISVHLMKILNIRNACQIYDAGKLYGLHSLTSLCTGFMDKNALQIVRHESFCQLSPHSVKDLLQRDSFYAPEVEIFRGVWNWFKVNRDCNMDSILEVVRLPLMSIQELLDVVRPSGLIGPEVILDAIHAATKDDEKDKKYRGFLLPGENVANPSWGTRVLQGEMRSAILDGNTEAYDLEKGYTKHTIGGTEDSCIIIRLGTDAIINHIQIILWDRDTRSYCYYVEMSMNGKDWTRVVDHTNYYCRSTQYLYFKARVARYIKIVGTYNTVNKVFHVVHFVAMYKDNSVVLEDGLIVPKTNVAITDMSATVVEGVSRRRNALLHPVPLTYDWDHGYTCHQLGSGCIKIQLGQPYMIDSMRLLLWDCDDRTYSYLVETSVDNIAYEIAVDRTRMNCKSWQTIRFERRPVVFIRITGTYNSINEVFHCVRFECPAPPEKSAQEQEAEKKKEEEEEEEKKKKKKKKKAESEQQQQQQEGDEGDEEEEEEEEEEGGVLVLDQEHQHQQQQQQHEVSIVF